MGTEPFHRLISGTALSERVAILQIKDEAKRTNGMRFPISGQDLSRLEHTWALGKNCLVKEGSMWLSVSSWETVPRVTDLLGLVQEAGQAVAERQLEGWVSTIRQIGAMPGAQLLSHIYCGGCCVLHPESSLCTQPDGSRVLFRGPGHTSSGGKQPL